MAITRIPLRRTAAWLAILSAPLANANVLLAILAVNLDLNVFSNPDAGLRTIAGSAQSQTLTELSLIADMLGFYLLVIPIAVLLREKLKETQPYLANLFTVFGLGYLLFGALGASVLILLIPHQLVLYTQTTGAESQTHFAIAGAFTDAIYNGLWAILDPLLSGVWWLGVGVLLWRQWRIVSAISILAAIASFLMLTKVASIDIIGLFAYYIFAPLWALVLGIRVLTLRETY
jgi:Domain of unknown function (DUF4386)